jgi:hypothetical protein
MHGHSAGLRQDAPPSHTVDLCEVAGTRHEISAVSPTVKCGPWLRTRIFVDTYAGGAELLRMQRVKLFPALFRLFYTAIQFSRYISIDYSDAETAEEHDSAMRCNGLCTIEVPVLSGLHRLMSLQLKRSRHPTPM